MRLGDVEPVGGAGERARALEQARALQRLVGELDGALEGALRVLGRGERRCALGCADEPPACARP